MSDSKFDWSIDGKTSFDQLKRDARAIVVAEANDIFTSSILAEQLQNQDIENIEKMSRAEQDLPLKYKIEFPFAENFVELHPVTYPPFLTGCGLKERRPKPLPSEVRDRIELVILDWMKSRGFSQVEYQWGCNCVTGKFKIDITVINVDKNSGIQELKMDPNSDMKFY